MKPIDSKNSPLLNVVMHAVSDTLRRKLFRGKCVIKQEFMLIRGPGTDSF